MKSFRGKSAFVCIPAFDTPGKKDASGAFRPESARLVKALGCNASVRIFDNNRAMVDRRKEVGLALERVQGLDLAAFLCHGWKDGIQAGWTLPMVKDLGARLALACNAGATVALYCCDTGRDADGDRKDDVGQGPGGRGGFASQLFMAMSTHGWKGQLWAHPTTAHTTMNPHVRVFRQDDDPELGDWAIEPHSERWVYWVRALRETEFRFRMLECETAAELAARVPT